jgi:FkbM family methyltransferase
METTRIQGVELITQGDAVILHAQRTGSFEPESIEAWVAAQEEGKVALDVGCYSGLYSIIALSLGFPVISFEPNPIAAERARQNAHLNGVELDLQQVGLSDQTGVFELHRKGGRPLTSAASIVTKHADSTKPEAVQVTTLQDINIDLPVSVIKIDAERSEHAIIRGGLSLIDRDSPEIITECLDGASSIEIYETLRPLGYQPAILSPNMIKWARA